MFAVAAARGRYRERDHDHLLTRHRADVVVYVHGPAAGGISHKPLEDRPCSEHEMAAELPHELGATAIARRMALDQPLLGDREHAPQVHDERVFDEAGLDVARAPAKIVLLEPRHRAAHRSFDLSAGSHARPSKGKPTLRRGVAPWRIGGLRRSC